MADEPVIFNADAHERISKTVRTVEGWVNSRRGHRVPKHGASPTLWVKPTSKAEGHGKYMGKILYGPDTIDAESDLTIGDIGVVDADEDEVLILNVAEVGKETWDLLDGETEGSNAAYNPLAFLGTVRGETEDGTLVVAIQGFKIFSCAEDAEEAPL
jgi:hypothetical protein